MLIFRTVRTVGVTLTCFVGDGVGFGHRLLIAQIDRRAKLKQSKYKIMHTYFH